MMFFVHKFTHDSFGDNEYQDTHAGRYGVLPAGSEHGGGFGQPDPDAALILTTSEEYAQRYAAHMNDAHNECIRQNGNPPDKN